jgi:chromosome partitioning protein
MQIICIANQKGGVREDHDGINLSASSPRRKKVLLADGDPQGNTTSSVGINKSD